MKLNLIYVKFFIHKITSSTTAHEHTMFSSKKLIPYLLIMFTLFSFARADEEDDLLGEIAMDLLVGVGMAVCETSAACSAMMTVVTVMVLLFMLCTCLCGSDRDRRDMWDSMPSARRVGTTGAGYYAAKSAFW